MLLVSKTKQDSCCSCAQYAGGMGMGGEGETGKAPVGLWCQLEEQLL